MELEGTEGLVITVTPVAEEGMNDPEGIGDLEGTRDSECKGDLEGACGSEGMKDPEVIRTPEGAGVA